MFEDAKAVINEKVRHYNSQKKKD